MKNYKREVQQLSLIISLKEDLENFIKGSVDSFKNDSSKIDNHELLIQKRDLVKKCEMIYKLEQLIKIKQ